MANGNNRRKKRTDLKTLIEVIFIILDAATLGTIFVFIGHDAGGPLECTAVNAFCKDSPGFIPLGTWTNMPSATTELMGNQSYRGAVMISSLVGVAHMQVGLEIGCIVPSNTLGANLQLQYANYTSSTHTNSSNFANIGISILIDNSANNPCPGFLSQNPAVVLPSITGSNAGFEFRVVGSGGGGSGDNPRFSVVSVQLRITTGANAIVTPQSVTTTGFTAFVFSWPYVALSAGKPLNFAWIAANSTVSVPTSESGTGTCTILIGTPSCTQAITFPTAFAATPNVVASITNTPVAAVIPIGTISLLNAETLTV